MGSIDEKLLLSKIGKLFDDMKEIEKKIILLMIIMKKICCKHLMIL